MTHLLILGDKFSTEDKPGPIDKPKTVQDVQQEPYKLPTGFEWSDMNVDDEKEVRNPSKSTTFH